MKFLVFVMVGGSWFPPRLDRPAPHLKFDGNIVLANGLDRKTVAALREQKWQEADWAVVFAVYTQDAFSAGLRQAIAGRYTLDKETIDFIPLFPFSAGEVYYAVFDYAALFRKLNMPLPSGFDEATNTIQLTFSIPRLSRYPTWVSSVYPSADTVPENLLRLYIGFSAPMSTGDAYQHIHLLDEKDRIVEKAFLTLDQELWDTERKRFTLLLDPGRIKRGLRSNLELGPPLKSAHHYRLVIDSTWHDEKGDPLAGTYEKKLVVNQPRRERLTTRNWQVAAPMAGSKSELVVQFDGSLDHFLALKYITLTYSSTGTIQGHAEMRAGDRRWIFSPDFAWERGFYTFEISPWLEDVSGNNFNNPFDLDLNESARVNSDAPVRLTFSVR